MSSIAHDRSMLGAYALGALDPREAQLVHEHLASCADCQREVADLVDLRAAMDDVPPEAFLDGPPDDGDLLLQRTLRAARAQQPVVTMAPPRTRRFGLVAASVAVLVAAALGGGILIGRQTAPESSVAAPAPNARHGEATDATTNVRMIADVTPQAGWVKVRINATGIPKGERCKVLVVPRNGSPAEAASWLTSERGVKDGTTLEGAAIIDPTEVVSIDVVNAEGKRFVSVPV
jgi:anti-sigma factor RsiW